GWKLTTTGFSSRARAESERTAAIDRRDTRLRSAGQGRDRKRAQDRVVDGSLAATDRQPEGHRAQGDERAGGVGVTRPWGADHEPLAVSERSRRQRKRTWTTDSTNVPSVSTTSRCACRTARHSGLGPSTSMASGSRIRAYKRRTGVH